jgi:hypothetical protein
VDLWDLTKLIFRRWYFSLPVLLVTMTATLLVSSSVKPDYSALGHLQLIPPANPTPVNPNETAANPNSNHNPWSDLGIQALGQAAVLKVSDQTVVKALVAQGYSGNYVISIDYPSTFFSVQVTGTTQQQTTNTVKKVMELLSQDVKAEQQQFGVAERDSITTLPLDAGEKVTAVTSKLKRVIIVATGVSLLFTAGFTIGLDALVRRWRVRLRATAPSGAGDEQDPVALPDEEAERGVVGARQVAALPAAQAVARPVSPRVAQATIVPPAIAAAVSANGRPSPRPAPAEPQVEHLRERPAQQPAQRPAEPGERVPAPAAASAGEERSADQTAVLALPLGGQLGVFQYLPNAKVLPGNGAEQKQQGEEPPTAADARSLPSDATIVLPKTLDDWKQESRGQGR